MFLADDRRATCDISGSLPIPPVHAIKIRKIRHQDLGNMRDSTAHYVLKMDVYKGREIGETKETNLGSKLVLKLSEPFQKSGRNIISDNFFTNVELERKLLMQNLTIVEHFERTEKSFLQNLCPRRTEKNLLLSMVFKKRR